MYVVNFPTFSVSLYIIDQNNVNTYKRKLCTAELEAIPAMKKLYIGHVWWLQKAENKQQILNQCSQRLQTGDVAFFWMGKMPFFFVFTSNNEEIKEEKRSLPFASLKTCIFMLGKFVRVAVKIK